MWHSRATLVTVPRNPEFQPPPRSASHSRERGSLPEWLSERRSLLKFRLNIEGILIFTRNHRQTLIIQDSNHRLTPLKNFTKAIRQNGKPHWRKEWCRRLGFSTYLNHIKPSFLGLFRLNNKKEIRIFAPKSWAKPFRKNPRSRLWKTKIFINRKPSSCQSETSLMIFSRPFLAKNVRREASSAADRRENNARVTF